MTHQLGVARGRDVVARWCALAEQRLEHLTELFETGRWRRYHSELAFLENIQEAKAAVEIWRYLSTREASGDNSLLDMAWLGRTMASLPRSGNWRGRVQQPQPKPAAIAAEPLPSPISIVPEAGPACSEEMSAAPVSDDPPLPAAAQPAAPARDIAATITKRYPLLRNAL